MALKTITTSAGNFKVRVDDWTSEHDIAVKIARKLGHRDAWITNSSGSAKSYQINIGKTTGRQMSVARTITVYR